MKSHIYDARLYSKSYLLSGGTSIPSNVDMDDYKNPGNYYCSEDNTAATLQNCPFDNSFILKVMPATGDPGNRYPSQTYRQFTTGNIAYRFFNADMQPPSWQQFVYFSDDATLKSNMQSPNFITDVESSTTLLELAQRRQNTWYSYPASVAPSDLPSYLTNSNVNYGIIVHTMSKVLTYITVYGVDQSNGVPCVITGCLVSAGDRIVWEDKT